MEVMCRAEFVPDPLPYEVSPDATAAEVLHDVCALFGRADTDTALEVDGVVVYVSGAGSSADLLSSPDLSSVVSTPTGGGGDVEVGSLGLHADSSVVVRRSRERVLALVAKVRPIAKDTWPEWVWADLIVVTAIVKLDGSALRFASTELKNTPSVVIEAVRQYGFVLDFASDEMRNTPSVVIEALKRTCGRALEFAGDEVKNTQSFVLEAVRQTGTALEFASDEMKNTQAVVLEAVKNDGFALKHASAEMKNTQSVVIEAVKNDGFALFFAGAEMQNTQSVVLEAVTQDCDSLQFASLQMKWTPSVVAATVKRRARRCSVQ